MYEGKQCRSAGGRVRPGSGRQFMLVCRAASGSGLGCNFQVPWEFYLLPNEELSEKSLNQTSKRKLLELKFAADYFDKENVFWRKLCSRVKQTCSCLATMSSSMFRGEKVRPLTPRTSYLLPSMVLALCWEPVLQPLDLVLQRKYME